jgi:hypothetical protein
VDDSIARRRSDMKSVDDIQENLGPNAKAFERHLIVGLLWADKEVTDYHPNYVRRKSDGTSGFIIFQDPQDVDSAAVCFEDGVEFGPDAPMIPITEDQPASILATMILVAMLLEKPMKPACPQCEMEEKWS